MTTSLSNSLTDRSENRQKSLTVITSQQVDIFRRLFPAHSVTDYFKYALEARCRYDVEQLFRHGVAALYRISRYLHVFVGIFHLDADKLVYEIMEACAV